MLHSPPEATNYFLGTYESGPTANHGSVAPRASAFQVAAPPATRPGRRACTLVLVANRSQNHRPDFDRMARYIRRIAPDVRPIVTADRPYNLMRPRLWVTPTLVFSPVHLRRFQAPRGPVFQGQSLKKSQELQRFEAMGLPVPRWRLLTESAFPDVSDFGKYVVSKPDQGGRGAEVKIRRKTRLRWRPPEYQAGGACTDLLVQEFIYTGPWPASYRVTTLFGQALWSWRVVASQDRRPLRGPDVFADGPTGGGMSIVSTGAGCRFSLNYEQDVIELAERAHAAFPGIPLIGVDIVREQPSGKLFLIEANACGHTWHFNGPTGSAIQRSSGFELENQFDGLRKAAHILIDETRRRAA